MLRFNYFLMRGGLLVGGDSTSKEDGSFQMTVKDRDHAKQLNEPYDKAPDCIKSFTTRDNNGKQPMPDGFPVVAIRFDGCEVKRAAESAQWAKNNRYQSDIYSWKPDLEKLLEQQSEYDQENGIIISEKDAIIVYAINKSRCKPKNIGLRSSKTHISLLGEDRIPYDEREVYFTVNDIPSKYWSSVCAIEKFSQFMKEMSEGEFVPTCNLTPAQAIILHKRAEDGNFLFESATTNFSLYSEKLSDNNLKSIGANLVHRQDSDLINLNKNQIKFLSEKWRYCFASIDHAEEVFKAMQDEGDLRPINLKDEGV